MKLETQIEVKAGYEKVLKKFSIGKSVNGNLEKEKNNNHNGINKEEKKNKKIRFSFMRNKSNDSEYDKLQKKLNNLEKEIDINNKSLLEQYKKLDKKKISLEKVTNNKERLIKKLNDIVQSSEKIKKELLKNLSEKLKLTAKFVSTNQY